VTATPTALKPPKTPTDPTTSGITTTNITFSWTAPTSDATNSAATGYEYFTNTTGTAPTVNGTATTSTSVNFTYTASQTPVAQYFWVRATNADGKSAWTSSITATPTAAAAPPAAVVWGTMAAPAFDRLNSSSRLRWGWNDQLPTSGDYTAADIRWEFQFSTTNTVTNQSGTVTGSKPRRTGGGLVISTGVTRDNRVSSLSSDYSVSYPAVAGEPVAFNTNPRYLRYRGVVVGTNGTTYRSNYSAWV
jgi:hypothetical protein